MSVHQVELGVLSDEVGARGKRPALVFRDSFPFEVVRHSASKKWVVCYCLPDQQSAWVFVCAHFPSGDREEPVFPFVNSLNVTLRNLERKLKKTQD